MCRRGRPSLVVLASAFVVAFAAQAASVPKGRRTQRKAATHVVVRPTDLEVQGVSARVAPGVEVVVAGARVGAPLTGKATATVLDGPELTGRIDGAALGQRLAKPTELYSVDGGALLGHALEGALVVVVGRTAGGLILCETVGAVRARVAIGADALTAEAHELVYPVVASKLMAAGAAGELAAAPGGRPLARVEKGARFAVLEDDARWAHVRSYGPFEIEGWLPRDRLTASDSAPPMDESPPRGLTPSHETLVDTPAFADAAGRKVAGTLRGGTLVTVGVEVVGPRVKVMTHGDVVAELWVARAGLRPLEPDIWNERN
jgi:hypothetical protein